MQSDLYSTSWNLLMDQVVIISKRMQSDSKIHDKTLIGIWRTEKH